MPRHVEGRRVSSQESIERGGDYYVSYTEAGVIEALWFAMPGFSQPLWNRIGGPGSDDKIQWVITESSGGAITVDPSIRSRWNEGLERRCWHGYLKGGVWEVLDDTVGTDL